MFRPSWSERNRVDGDIVFCREDSLTLLPVGGTPSRPSTPTSRRPPRTGIRPGLRDVCLGADDVSRRDLTLLTLWTTFVKGCKDLVVKLTHDPFSQPFTSVEVSTTIKSISVLFFVSPRCLLSESCFLTK